MAMTPAANQQWTQVWWSCWQVFKWFCNSVLLCWRPCSIGGASLTSAAAKAMNNAKSILMGVLKKRHSSCWNCAWIQLLSFLPTLYGLPWLCSCPCCLKKNAQTWAWPSTKNGFHKRPSKSEQSNLSMKLLDPMFIVFPLSNLCVIYLLVSLAAPTPLLRFKHSKWRWSHTQT